jgi:hypothetical protein
LLLFGGIFFRGVRLLYASSDVAPRKRTSVRVRRERSERALRALAGLDDTPDPP